MTKMVMSKTKRNNQIVSQHSKLRHVQSSVNGNSFRTRVVRTRVVDLFDDDWKNIMEPLVISMRNVLSKSTEKLNSKDEIHNELEGTCSLSEIQMTMHHCDARMGLGDIQNSELKGVLGRTDIIHLQHVLHENFSMIIPVMDNCNSSAKTRGVVFDLLKKSEAGNIHEVH